MEKAKRKRLEKAGWKLGSVAEFLGLSEEEVAIVESRLRPIDQPPSCGRTNLDRVLQPLSLSRRKKIAARARKLLAEDGAAQSAVTRFMSLNSKRRGGGAPGATS
jgi:hypothetical protein